MVAPSDPWIPPSKTLQRAKRLRALANECRELARMIHYRPDREQVLKMAQQYDAEVTQLEAVLGLDEDGHPRLTGSIRIPISP